MISNERKEELYNTWYSWSDWTDAGRQAWEEFLDNLPPDEQEYIAHISALYQLWSNYDFDEWEEDDWYISLPSDDQALVDAWNEEQMNMFKEQESKQKNDLLTANFTLSKERKEELYNAWYSWGERTDGETQSWEVLYNNLLPDEQKYIENLDTLFWFWRSDAFEGLAGQNFYHSLPSDYQALIDAWNKKYNKAYGQLLIKNIEQERKQKEEP